MSSFDMMMPASVCARVESLWASAEHPVLVCALQVDHTITEARVEVDVVISSEGVTIHHRSSGPARPAHEETRVRSTESPEDLASRLRALGVLDLGSVEQSMYDGFVAEIAARDADGWNVFSDRSINTPQAKVRETLLALAHEREIEIMEVLDQLPAREESGSLWTIHHRP
jgi:hypothetical protein